MDDERFAKDHAAGEMTLTASRIPPLVLPRSELAEHDPSPLAIALHCRGDVPIVVEDPDPLAIGLLELGHIDERLGEALLAKRGMQVVDVQPRYEREDLGFRLIAYPDAIVDTSDGILGVEFKRLSGGKRQYEAEWLAGPPLRHVAQVEAQMIAAGADERSLAAVLLVPLIIERWSVTTEPVLIEPDADRQGAIVEACRDWWRIVSAGELPEADASESSYRALLATTKLQEGKRVLVPGDDWVAAAETWRWAKEKEKEHHQQAEAAKCAFASIMADATEAVLDDGSIVKRSIVKPSTYTVNRKASWRWTV